MLQMDTLCDDNAGSLWPDSMSIEGEWGDGIALCCASMLYKRNIEVMVDGRLIHVGRTSTTGRDTSAALNENSPILLGFVATPGSSTKNHYVHLSRKANDNINQQQPTLNGMPNCSMKMSPS